MDDEFQLLYTMSAEKASISNKIYCSNVQKFEPNKQNEYYEELSFNTNFDFEKITTYFQI